MKKLLVSLSLIVCLAVVVSGCIPKTRVMAYPLWVGCGFTNMWYCPDDEDNTKKEHCLTLQRINLGSPMPKNPYSSSEYYSAEMVFEEDVKVFIVNEYAKQYRVGNQYKVWASPYSDQGKISVTVPSPCTK